MWLVGGTLRDLLLARAVPEVDAVVDRGAGELAAKLEEAGVGRSILLSPRAPRVFRIAGRRELDLAEIESGSIETDLARRDFTVNALAFDLQNRAWIDPFGGRRDLARRRLSVVRPENLRDDPLRVLRAARLFATHGLRPDPATTRACRSEAPRIAEAAPERVRSELVKLLEAPRVAEPLRWAARVGALEPAAELPSRAAGAVARSLARMDDARIRRMDPAERRRLRLALIAAAAGLDAPEAARWLAKRRFSRAESNDVARLIDLSSSARKTSGARHAWAWVRDAGDRWREALVLLRLRWPREARRAAILARRATMGSRQMRLPVGGEEILRWTARAPGPAIGRLLRDLEIEVLRGAVRSKREARTWAKKRTALGERDD